MTNEVNYTPIKYACNGSTVKFSFNWKIIEPEDLVVLLEDELTLEQVKLVDGVDYTLEFGDVGGEITTLITYPAGKNIVIAREVSRYQDKTYSTSSGFQTKQIEESFDRLSANVQDLAYTLDRALKVPIGSGKLNVEFPEKLINDNTLVWSDEKDAFVNYDVIGEMDSFEQEIEADVDSFKNTTNQTLQQNKENTDADILNFKQSVNSEISSFKQNVSSQIETFEQEVESDVDSFKNTTNQTLQQNKENTDADILSFKQSVNSEVSSFKQNVSSQIETFEQEQQTAYDEFTAGVDEKIEKVADAAEKIDELEESVVIAVEAAEQATKAAEELTGALDSFAKNDEVVHLANAETITGAKTFSQPVKIQNGTGTGSLIIGGDVNASTLNNGTRKLARIVVPMQTDNTLNATLLGFDSSGDADLNITNKSYDNIAFGGSKKITNTTSPMSISFCVATERNAKEASRKRYPLEMDSNEVRFNVQPNYNGVNLATTVDITNALKTKQDTLTAGDNIEIVDNIISAKGGGSLPVGTIIPVNANANYVPDGTLPCDGAEYTREQFTDFCKNYLDGEYSQYLATCSYEKFEEEVANYGQCSKFAVKGNTTIKYDISYTTVSIQVLPIILQAYPSGVELEFTYDGTSWLLDGKAVALSDYYITATGTATAGDHFTVTAGLIETFRVPLIKDTETVVTNNIDYDNYVETNVYHIVDNPFIAPFDGVFVQELSGNKNKTVHGYLNGVLTPYVYNDGEATAVPQTIYVPMSKSDTFYWSDEVVYTCNGKFYPYKEETKDKLKSFVVVANGQTNQSLMDWSAWASSLQGRLDTDVNNITNLGKANITDLLSPDYSAGVEKVWGETYTAEVSGWVWYCIRYATNASTNVVANTCLYIDEVPMGVSGGQKGNAVSQNSGLFKIGKGSTYRTQDPSAGGTNGSITVVKFFPDKGVTNA